MHGALYNPQQNAGLDYIACSFCNLVSSSKESCVQHVVVV